MLAPRQPAHFLATSGAWLLTERVAPGHGARVHRPGACRRSDRGSAGGRPRHRGAPAAGARGDRRRHARQRTRRRPTTSARASIHADKQGGWRRPAEIAPREPALTLRTCGVMPAEGAMTTKLEAPAQEPRNVEGGGTASLAGVSRAFGAVRALDGVDLEVARRRDRRRRRAQRLRQDDPARARVRAAGARRRQRARRPRGAHAPARRPAALAARDRQRRARPAPGRGVARARRARARTRSSPPSAWRASSAPAPTSSRAACASAWPSCARCSRASRSCASTSPSPRSTR